MMTFLLSAGAMIIVLLLIICIPLLTFRKKDTGAEELPQAILRSIATSSKNWKTNWPVAQFLRMNMTKAVSSSSAA